MNHGKIILEEASKHIGVKELPGRNNPKIMEYFQKAGFPEIKSQRTPWCAAFLNAVLADAGYKGTSSLLAKSFLNYGVPVAVPRPGDLVIYNRGSESWQGHVHIFEKWDNTFITGIGGNQRNAVNRQRYPRSDLVGFRRITDAEKLGVTEKVEDTKSVPRTLKDATAPVVTVTGVTTAGLSLFKEPVVIAGLTFSILLGILVGFWLGRRHPLKE